MPGASENHSAASSRNQAIRREARAAQLVEEKGSAPIYTRAKLQDMNMSQLAEVCRWLGVAQQVERGESARKRTSAQLIDAIIERQEGTATQQHRHTGGGSVNSS